MLSKYWVLAVVGGIGLAASSAFAGHNEPKKAASIKGELLTAYEACTAPNDTINGSALALPACHPAVRSDPTCGFVAGIGSGKFSAKAKAGDIFLTASLSGLDAACNGETLQVTADLRVTGDNCVSADPDGCTVSELTNFPVPGVTCVVAAGKCTIKTSVNTALPGLLASGTHRGIGLGAISLSHGAARAFQGGLLIP